MQYFHNLILIGQPSLMTNLHLSVNEDIKSRITFSVIIPRLNPDHISHNSTTYLSKLYRLKVGNSQNRYDGKETFNTSHYGIRSIPQALLVNTAGIVVWKGHPSTLTFSFIEEKLK